MSPINTNSWTPIGTTSVVKGDRVYLCSEQGYATCLETATGKQIWQERLAGTFSALPVCAGNNIYCVSDKGDVFVLAAKDEFEQLARVPLGEPTQATPQSPAARLCSAPTKACSLSLGNDTPDFSTDSQLFFATRCRREELARRRYTESV